MSATATLAPAPPRTVAWSRMGDESLAARAAGGDSAAFSALYERYHGPLLGYTRSILRDAEDARDATQNALENALRALPERDPGRPLRPWLYKIAHNEAITIMRRRRPQTELTPAFEPIVPGPEVDAEQRGRLEQLVDDLQRLPERQRGALVMRELNGLSYEEIGTALGLTNEAARRAVFDARNALHDAADGRATECTSVRHTISDGDRRSLRARRIRAHLRSCDACSSFQRSIGTRRADLHALAPWLSGAAVAGALGFGSAGTGGVLLAGGAGASAGGAGAGVAAGWASLSTALKGIAVAAAVATTGTAAVEIKQATQPSQPAPKSQTVQARPSHAGAAALKAAVQAARAAGRQRTAASARRADRVRAQSGTASSSTLAVARPDRNTPALQPPAPQAERKPAPAAAAPAPAPAATKEPAAAKAPPVTAVEKLDALRDQVQKAFADAQAIAADGTSEALALATGLLDRTLGPLQTSINRVLATLGLAPLSINTAAPAPATQPTTTNVLAPVQQVLTGMQELLQRLLGTQP